ncbi:HNH endonuclease [uncultured Cohaesibacter sp.]
MEKRFGSLAIKGKDIDHKNFNTSNNSWSNLSIMSRKANRSKQPKRK